MPRTPFGAPRGGALRAPRDSAQGYQRVLGLLAILALARKAHLVPLIFSPPAQRRSARMPRSTCVDLVTEFHGRFTRRRCEVLT